MKILRESVELCNFMESFDDCSNFHVDMKDLDNPDLYNRYT